MAHCTSKTQGFTRLSKAHYLSRILKVLRMVRRLTQYHMVGQFRAVMETIDLATVLRVTNSKM